MESKENIELSDNITHPLKFEVSNNKLSLEYVQSYFPNATGIKYGSDNVVECVNGAFHLKPGVHKYDVYYPPKFVKDVKGNKNLVSSAVMQH